MSVDVSPDGRTIAFDLLGDLYLLPIDGGNATVLTSGPDWDQSPRFSSDGAHIFFTSDRIGHKNVWRVEVASGRVGQITKSSSDFVGPLNWSYDQSHLIAAKSSDAFFSGESSLTFVHPETAESSSIGPIGGTRFDLQTMSMLRPGRKEFSGVQDDRNYIYFDETFLGGSGQFSTRIIKLDVEHGSRSALTPKLAEYSEYNPQVSPDGKTLVTFRQLKDRTTELWKRDLDTGSEQRLASLGLQDDANFFSTSHAHPSFAFTPDGSSVVYSLDGKIRRSSLTGEHNSVIPFQAKVSLRIRDRVMRSEPTLVDMERTPTIRWPQLAPDGKALVFSANGYIWRKSLNSGHVERLTQIDQLEFMPSFSRDGEKIVFVSFERTDGAFWSSCISTLQLESRTPERILCAEPGENLMLPSFSPDGQRIAFIKESVNGSNDAVVEFGWSEIENPDFRSVHVANDIHKYARTFFYTHFISFNMTGEKLIFSYPSANWSSLLMSANIDGSSKAKLAEYNGFAKTVPSPDGSIHALSTFSSELLVVPSFDENAPPENSLRRLNPANTLDIGGANYVNWNQNNTLVYAFGDEVSWTDFDNRRSESITLSVPSLDSSPGLPVAITDVSILTFSKGAPSYGRIDSGTIVFSDGLIVDVGRKGEVEIPPLATVVEMPGKIVMPGLIDSHYHRIGGSRGVGVDTPNMFPTPWFDDDSAIRFGVTVAWEPGGTGQDGSPAAADLQAAGRILGPRWEHSAAGSVGFPFDTLISPEAAMNSVNKHKKLGVKTLKEYSTPTRQQRRWLVEAARKSNLGIVSHIDSFDGLMTRVFDGFTGGDHPHFTMKLHDDVYRVLEETGYIWTPNILIASGTIGKGSDRQNHFLRELSSTNPAAFEKYAAAFKQIPNIGEFSDNEFTHRTMMVAQQAAMVALRGGRIAVSAHSRPAAYLHMEMWYLAQGGMPVGEVLLASTLGNAEKLGIRNQTGSIEPGKSADFIILSDDPFENILNTLALDYTVQGGAIFESSSSKRLNPTELKMSSKEGGGYPLSRSVNAPSFSTIRFGGASTHFCPIHGDWHKHQMLYYNDSETLVDIETEKETTIGVQNRFN